MARVRYKAMLAADPTTGMPRPELAGLTGQIVVAGTSTPTDITDNNAIPYSGSALTVSAEMFVPTFWSEAGLEEVDWLSGEYRIPLDSNQGTRDAAVAASLAAQTAQIAAEGSAASALAAQAAAEALAAGGGGGGIFVEGDGDYTMPVWDGTGVQPARVYAAGHPAAGTVIPTWVHVIWQQSAQPTTGVLPGDGFRKVG